MHVPRYIWKETFFFDFYPVLFPSILLKYQANLSVDLGAGLVAFHFSVTRIYYYHY